MTIFSHEIKQNRKMLIIWSLSVGLLMVTCMMLYPQMQSQMEDINKMYSSMGSFSEAFGMDKLNFGTVMGFYGIECGNILGIGGAFFAAMVGISMLSKEESGHTAEFLLTHGVSRKRIVSEKLLAVLTIIVVFNAICIGLSAISFKFIGEEIAMKEFLLFHLAQFIMQCELAFICYGISSYIKRGGNGIGIGIACLGYFLNIILNISDKAQWLKYVTPFAYSDAADILSKAEIKWDLIGIGIFYAIAGAAIGFWQYCKKDIVS